MPAQLRQLLLAQAADLHAEFVRLLPSPHQPIRIQRWTARRIGLGLLMLALLVLAATNSRVLFDNKEAVQTPLNISSLGCTDLEPLWLQAQAVPSAKLVPCVRYLPVGWSVADVAVNNGRSVITLNHDRAGAAALVVRLTVACNPTGAVETPAAEPSVRSYKRIVQLRGEYSTTWYDRFPGGCVTYRLHSTSDLVGQFANEARSLLGFTTRAALGQALDERSNGRLQLDPGDAP